MYERLLNEFKNNDLNIISEIKLVEYVNFCIEKNIGKKIKGKTALHHILPKAKLLPFDAFSNLKENSWNGVYLFYKDHYYAHWLLSEAIEHISIISSFCAMHYKDFKLQRVKVEELIGPEQFQIKMEKKTEIINDSMQIIVEYDDIKMTKLERKGKKISKTLNKEIEIDSIVTSKAKLRGKKISKTLNKEIEIDGNTTTISELRATKSADTMKIKNADGLSIYDIKKIKEIETKSQIIEFEGKQITLAKKHSILSARTRSYKQNEINTNISLAKIKKGVVFDIYYKDKLILENVPYLYINKNYQSLKGLKNKSNLRGKYMYFWVEEKPFMDTYSTVEDLLTEISKII